MNDPLRNIIDKSEQGDFRDLVAQLGAQPGRILLRNDILLVFAGFCDERKKSPAFRRNSSMARFLARIQEILVRDEYLAIMHRHVIARYRFYLLRVDCAAMDEITVREYLDLKDLYVTGVLPGERHLRIDLLPFYDFSPNIKDARSIGNGTRYLNRFLCSNIFNRPGEWNDKLFQFLKLHRHNEQQLLVNGSILPDFAAFFPALQAMHAWLKDKPPAAPAATLEKRMREKGFEPGWGDRAGRMAATMETLIDLINEPADYLLERFLSLVPMPLISKIAVISPHGWFAQENVLGRPDTGGQVIYILDQVRALEKHLQREIAGTGLAVNPAIAVITRYIPNAENTRCNVAREKIHHTDNCWILRVPFKDREGRIVDNWTSRFHVWPYLERFAEDAALRVLSEFNGRPDLIIGNYSDGNLVASLMSDRLDVIQCTIAHALEKTKYLFSDLYWRNLEEYHHFSLQFTADLIAMNKSDFIISSTHQEIIGTEESMGQYESYQFFTLPGLFQVQGGIDLFAPKFNVISPGVDEQIFFPYHEQERRTAAKTRAMEARLLHDAADDVFGRLRDPDKPPIFTLARFDRIKNITGLIEAFGMSKALRAGCNLVFSAGTVDPGRARDPEEREEIEKAHALIERYALHDQVRWLPGLPRLDTGEAYRVMADRRGVFVQPALFEAFGLTILEAMLSGLPTFGPLFGGPQEIIENGVSGGLINTSRPGLIAAGIEPFIAACARDAARWEEMSRQGIRRVRESFTWKLYSEKLIGLAKLYGFWRYSISKSEKQELNRYCDILYYFLFKQRADALPGQ